MRCWGKGHETIPDRGWLPVTVPGIPAAWRDLHRHFGTLSFPRLLEPAVRSAEEGHPVSAISVWHWRWQVEEVHPGLTGAALRRLPMIPCLSSSAELDDIEGVACLDE